MAKLGKSQREKDVVRVASVAAYRYGQLLFGKRNDNGRWTLPGGHLEPGESPTKGAVRELLEEANLKPKKLTLLGEQTIEGKDGARVQVFAFRADVEGEASGKNDPDEECTEWRWVSPKKLPDEIMGNLHSKRNVTLQLLGLQRVTKSEATVDDDADEAAYEARTNGDEDALAVGQKVTITKTHYDPDYPESIPWTFRGPGTITALHSHPEHGVIAVNVRDELDDDGAEHQFDRHIPSSTWTKPRDPARPHILMELSHEPFTGNGFNKSEVPEADESLWPVVDAGITPEEAREHEQFRRAR